ncbi:glucosamine-6-phosphate deaminase [Ectobacillus ponti]|uniref:Glucosamine-6-phosphate deaminase n=1 Tax=Ectobacillus ponti TaxID=2961894 RepID=A0AA41XAF0_9BACI|nr:glucosamine-6-phosphate deaminase [Ectobacillus ponti]MCP8969875.1 glucosamine-6-phosphate deaminase [Ectobacillus ponti]
MKLIEVRSYEELSRVAADCIIDRVKSNPAIKLGLATGGTPVGTYRNLILDHEANGTAYRQATTFNLDEYVGLDPSNPGSYRYFMQERLFHWIDIPAGQTHVPSGVCSDPERECEAYEDLIRKAGGIDLQLLGIGGNGHIGFNEPGTSFHSLTHLVELDPSTREANARFFSSREEVPTHAITMGIRTIMDSREILLLVSGEGKRQALKQLLNGPVTEEFPASILQRHPHVTVIADSAALGRQRRKPLRESVV